MVEIALDCGNIGASEPWEVVMVTPSEPDRSAAVVAASAGLMIAAVATAVFHRWFGLEVS